MYNIFANKKGVADTFFKITAVVLFLTYLMLPMNSFTLTSRESAVTHLYNGFELAFGSDFSLVHFAPLLIPVLLFFVFQFNLFKERRFVVSIVLSGTGVVAVTASIIAMAKFYNSVGANLSSTTSINYFEIGTVLSFILYIIVGTVSLKHKKLTGNEV